jgi:hypothetical protein
MSRNAGIIVASLSFVLVAVAIGVILRRSGGDTPMLWTWLFPAAVVVGVLPLILNAAIPQHVVLDNDGMEVVRWSGRRRLPWSDIVEAISYSTAQDLFLRIRSERSRILLSTRNFGWDADDLASIARRVDELLVEVRPDLERATPLDKFPSWFSKSSGLRRKGRRAEGSDGT